MDYDNEIRVRLRSRYLPVVEIGEMFNGGGERKPMIYYHTIDELDKGEKYCESQNFIYDFYQKHRIPKEIIIPKTEEAYLLEELLNINV